MVKLNCQLDKLLTGIRTLYQGSQPFPHVVVKGLFDDESLHNVVKEVNSYDWSDNNPEVIRKNKPLDGGINAPKSTTSRCDQVGKATHELVQYLLSDPFVKFLSELSGIDGLMVDPKNIGGGIHRIPPGGYLKVHADFNVLPIRRTGYNHDLHRRVNLLLYLNNNWLEEWGGHLELWNHEMTRCVKKVSPALNTLVIFTSTSDSYHGHPDPLLCPPGVHRQSIALYYYTVEPPDDYVEPHGTLYQSRKVNGVVID